MEREDEKADGTGGGTTEAKRAGRRRGPVQVPGGRRAGSGVGRRAAGVRIGLLRSLPCPQRRSLIANVGHGSGVLSLPNRFDFFLEHPKSRRFGEGLILAAELAVELSHTSPLLALLTLHLPASRGLVVVALRAGLASTADLLGIKSVPPAVLGSFRLAQRRRLQHLVELVLLRPALRTVIVVGKQSALPASLLAPVV